MRGWTAAGALAALGVLSPAGGPGRGGGEAIAQESSLAAVLLVEEGAPLEREAASALRDALLAPGRRTVAAALRAMGLAQEPRFARYHRVLSRARWSGLAVGRVLLGLLVAAFVPDGPLVVGLDETIERRRGAKIAAKGIYRDPVRSSHSHFVKASGLRWVCLMLLVPIP